MVINVLKTNVRLKFCTQLSLFFLVLTLLLPLALAETGCFTYKDSPFFCSDISKEEAINECQLYGCNLEQSFYPQRSCSEKEILQKCELSIIVDVPEELPAIPELVQEVDETLPEEETNSALIVGIIILFIAIFIIYILYKQNPDYIKKIFQQKKQQQIPQLNVIQEAPEWLQPKDNSRLEEQKNRWKKEHKQKINEFHRNELLQEFGPKYERSVTKEFRKLKGLVRTYKRRKKQVHKSNPEEHFIKLEQLGKKIKEKEQVLIQSNSKIDPKIIKKHELDNLMEDLKEISNRKN